MMCVLEESMHALCCQATTERVDEIVVMNLALELTVRDHCVSRMRVNSRDLSLQKAYAAVEHRFTQIERDIILLTKTEGQADERRVKDELACARDERDLMLWSTTFS